MKPNASVPVWLRWTRRLPPSTRAWLARHWRKVAGKRITWADWVIGEKKDGEE